MAKTQKTFLLNPQLLELIDKVAEHSGASFTKIVTAALLQYFFDYCEHPEDGGPIVCPASQWMRRASRLDAGLLTLGEIPLDVLLESVAEAKYMLGMDKSGNLKEGRADHWKKALRIREGAVEGWHSEAKDKKGGMAAILESVEEFYRQAKA